MYSLFSVAGGPTTPLRIETNMRIAMTGSLNAPEKVLSTLSEIAFRLTSSGCLITSGFAEGAEQAAAAGAVPGRINLFLPWPKYNLHPGGPGVYIPPPEGRRERLAFEQMLRGTQVISKPIWKAAMDEILLRYPSIADSFPGSRRLASRSYLQVLGEDLETPVDFLVCWAPKDDNGVKGGGRYAYEIAMSRNIPCYNIFFGEDLEALTSLIQEIENRPINSQAMER